MIKTADCAIQCSLCPVPPLSLLTIFESGKESEFDATTDEESESELIDSDGYEESESELMDTLDSDYECIENVASDKEDSQG